MNISHPLRGWCGHCRKKGGRRGDVSDSDYSASEASGDEGGSDGAPPPPPPLESDGPQSEEGSEGNRLRQEQEQELSSEDDELEEADRATEVCSIPYTLHPISHTLHFTRVTFHAAVEIGIRRVSQRSCWGQCRIDRDVVAGVIHLGYWQRA